ncbi:ABC-type transport auxiliary lipoprotein family protein [Desulfonema magnum]|nr:ABC-type transport auxiliary lipoprotein family protein [Desulfonema magnum]
MNHSEKIFFLFVFVVLSLAGCLNLKETAQKINYYSLEYDPPVVRNWKLETGNSTIPNSKSQIPNPKSPPLPFVIRVERFQAAPFYDTNKIVFKEGAFKRDTYIYHKWWAKPGDIVSYFLARDIKASGLFEAVFAFDKSLSCSHLIEGTVDEFFEQDEADSWQAVLAVSITLMAENEPDISKKILLQKKYNAKELCAQKNPRHLAEAMGKALSKISEKIITDIHNCLSFRSQKTKSK